jgi:hypothetical protein
MGSELIRVTFGDGDDRGVYARENYEYEPQKPYDRDSDQPELEIRTHLDASDEELSEQVAKAAACLQLAAEDGERELINTLSRNVKLCFRAFGRALKPPELRRIQKRSNEIMDEILGSVD